MFLNGSYSKSKVSTNAFSENLIYCPRHRL